MKLATKHTVYNVLKVGFITTLLGALMLCGVDLFKNLDNYINYAFPSEVVLKLALLSFPDSFLMALGPAFLFSVTYYLAMLNADNELICLLNSGISMKKILKPIYYIAIFIGIMFFLINEAFAINMVNERDALRQSYMYENNHEMDNNTVSLSDPNARYTVYCDKYIDSEKSLYGVTIVHLDESGKMLYRIDAKKADWNESSGNWILYNAQVFTPESGEVSIKTESIIENSILSLEPELFKNLSSDVSKMSLKLAYSYMLKLKLVNSSQFAQIGTSFYKRVLGCLTPVIMILISCCMNFRFRKNVLFFSIVCSLCIAVVYYVVQMMTIMMANQGLIAPALGMIIPFMIISLFAFGFIAMKKE